MNKQAQDAMTKVLQAIREYNKLVVDEDALILPIMEGDMSEELGEVYLPGDFRDGVWDVYYDIAQKYAIRK